MSMVPWNAVERILVACFGGIGDVVRSGPALRALHSALPEATITLMSQPDGCQAAALLPWVDEVIECTLNGPDIRPESTRNLYHTITSIRHRNVNAALILTEVGDSPYVPAYICYLAGIPIRIGQTQEFGGTLLSHAITPPESDTPPVQRHLHLLEAAGIASAGDHLELHVPEVLQLFTDQRLRALGLIPEAAFAVLAPCTEDIDRQQNWAGVVRNLAMPLLVIAEDGGVRHKIKTLRSGIPCIGRTSVSELAAIVRRASLIATNNPDLGTLAAALERSVASIASFTGDDGRSAQRRLAVASTGTIVDTSTRPTSDYRQDIRDETERTV